jgi:ABC-2 type transport system ATP-binding protein
VIGLRLEVSSTQPELGPPNDQGEAVHIQPDIPDITASHFAPAIEVSELRKTYPGGVEAVKGVDFSVAQGEAFGLLGPNGAGKSTTIGMLTTTIVPTGGTARVAGFDVATAALAARRVSSVVFQESVLDRGLTGRSNLQIHGRLWGVDNATARERISELVETIGLAEIVDRKVSSYSGGQRRRLEIARALVSQPRVLFLDEPTVGLDPRIRFELLEVIARLRDRADTTILLTTHYLDEAERLCDRVAIMHDGLIVALDTPAALLAALGREIVELRIDGPAEVALAAPRSRGVAGDDAFIVGSTLTVPLHDHSSVDAISVIHGLRLAIAAMSTRQPTLDDVYLQLTGDSIAVAA